MVCASVLVGCSKQEEPPEEFKSSFTKEDNAAENITTNNIQNNENSDQELVFGEHTYNDSVQINQKDLGWATYDEVPNDIFLMNFAYFPCGSVCQMPDWETEIIENIAVSKKDNNIIAISIVRMTDMPDGRSITDELFNLMKTNYGAKSLETTETHIDEDDYQFWSIVEGSIDGKKDYPYILRTYNDGEFGYLAFAAWDANDIYTQERMEQTLQEIQATFNLYPMPEEMVDELGEVAPVE